MKILITGANGFLGIHTSLAALEAGAVVSGIDLSESYQRGEKARSSLMAQSIIPERADLSDPEKWREALHRIEPDVVIQLAGLISRAGAGDPAVNVVTTTSMLQALSSLPLQDRPVVVYPGSQLEYGAAPMPWTERTVCRPADPYADSKQRAAKLLLTAVASGECKAAVIRFPIVYGPCQAPTMFIPELIAKALTGAPFRMTAGGQRRRFIYVTDAASLMLNYGAALRDGAELPPLLNAPASEPLSMRQVAERIVDLMGRDVRLEIGAIPMRDSEVMEQWPDDSLALGLGFSCETGIDEGLARTVRWFKDNGWFLQRGS